jgi:cyclase
VAATIEQRRALADTIRAVSSKLFIPLAVGGGIRSEADADAVIEAGADKVSLNSAPLAEPQLLTRLAGRYGSQAVVVAIDAKRENGRYAVFSPVGPRPRVMRSKGRRRRGARSWRILLTSIDRDGPVRVRLRDDGGLSSAVAIPVPLPGAPAPSTTSWESSRLALQMPRLQRRSSIIRSMPSAI